MDCLLLRKRLVFIRRRRIANLPKRMCLVLHKLPATDDLVSRSNLIDIQSSIKIMNVKRNQISRATHFAIKAFHSFGIEDLDSGIVG